MDDQLVGEPHAVDFRPLPGDRPASGMVGEQHPGTDALIKVIGKGRRLTDDVGEALERLFGVPVGAEGLSRLFQPGFPGVRTFVVETHVTSDQCVELTIAGIARDGAPVWSGTRCFVPSRSGALEIHHGVDDIATDYRSRNITVDVTQRELDILELLELGPASRITIDAHGVASYLAAVHGFEFADESDEGPPVRSVRALEPSGDRERIIEAAPVIIERIAQRHGASKGAVDAAIAALAKIEHPWDLAVLAFSGVAKPLADGDDGDLGIGALGKELLLSRDLPPWRAALPLGGTSRAHELGKAYRRRKSQRSEMKIAFELQEARDQLDSPKREVKSKALKTLGAIAPTWIIPDVKAIEEGRDRKLAAVARLALRQISGADLSERMLAYADNPKNDPRHRGLAYRVLAEHYKARLAARVSMLRVSPDARIQRAVIPLIAEDPTDAGPQLASLLAANPAFDGRAADRRAAYAVGGEHRPGLFALRQELIDRLSRMADPRTLPALMGAYRAEPPPPPHEQLALARALLAFPDPRAQLALKEVSRRVDRPAIP